MRTLAIRRPTSPIDLEIEIRTAASRLRMAEVELEFLKRIDLHDSREFLEAQQEGIEADAGSIVATWHVHEALKTATADERLQLVNLAREAGLEMVA